MLRTCRADGVLVKPDVPLAALERCFAGHTDARADPARRPSATPTIRSGARATWSRCTRTARTSRCASGSSCAELGDAAPRGPVASLDWRSGRIERLERGAGWSLELAPRAFDFRVLAPLAHGELAVFGDVAMFATAGDRRIRDLRASARGVAFDVLGAPGERVTITGWSARALASCSVDPGQPSGLAHDRATGRFDVAVEIPDRGYVSVELR